MDILIRNTDYSKQNQLREIECLFANVNTSMVNSIRRILLSEIPCIGFRQNNIDIVKNTTAAHNEFITHRLSLVPIYQHPKLKFYSFYDKQTKQRKYEFDEDVIVPEFGINKQNTNNFFNMEKQIIDVMSNDFSITEPGKTEQIPFDEFFKKDLYTGDYVLILNLKASPTDPEKGGHLHFKTIPVISNAIENACFLPIGNVAYSFEQETQEIIDLLFEKYFDRINQERLMKNETLEGDKKLNLYTEQEKKDMRKSFYLLDAQRIYKKNNDGECNSIILNVESIGTQDPRQSILNSFSILQTKFIDLLNNITFTNSEVSLNNTKLSFRFENNALYFKMYNENHTIGNLLIDYLNRCDVSTISEKELKPLFKNTDNPFFEYASGDITHYLENDFEIKVSINENALELSENLLKGVTYNRQQRKLAPYMIGIYKTILYIIKELDVLSDIYIKSQEYSFKNGDLMDVIDKISFNIRDNTYNDKLFFE